MSGDGPTEGFILHAFTRTHRRATQLCLIGRLTTGETFAAILPGEHPTFYLRAADEARLHELLAGQGGSPFFETAATLLTTMDGEGCVRVTATSTAELARIARQCGEAFIRTYEADLRLPERFLIDRAIHGPVHVEGLWTAGQYVDRVYRSPELRPSTASPPLSLLSLDIETDPYGSQIYAISSHFRSLEGEVEDSVILLRGEKNRGQLPPGDRTIPGGGQPWRLIVVDGETELLRRWADQIGRYDPDIITGWNVSAFDFGRIAERFRHHGLPLRIGRSGEEAVFFPASDGRPATITIPGRQVVDAMRVSRAGPRHFPDHSLETVAREVLGRGKQIEAVSTGEKLREIERMYGDDPAALCRYCLDDARLVVEILEATGLLALTMVRSRMTGLPLSRAWTSIAAFDFMYIEALHRRKIVAPTLGVDALPFDTAPGGAIISPVSGLSENVLVFDFKGLYPSIIRTFNIDPLSLCRDSEDADAIQAPNGARFRRDHAILPALLDRFAVEREAARRNNDETAAYVIKILQNSFYGVLGSSGCRFAGSQLAGAITAFGQQLLYWCRDFLQREGLQTLYGDTDSLFVRSNLPRGSSNAELDALGDRLCRQVNDALTEHLSETYRVASRLELEFEKVYLRFFVPPLRNQGRSDGGTQQGRAKGYAGYLRTAGPGETEGRIEVKGMEAVRHDWTEAARELQLALLRMLFEDEPSDRVLEFLHDFEEAMRDGTMDRKLVYARALRKPVDGYTNSAPPHVRAARLLDPADQSGLLRYVWTTAGPQPVLAQSAPLDYDHYLDKQLRPILSSFAEILGIDAKRAFDADRQLGLFD